MSQPADLHISLTIYNQGTSLVRDRRLISLDAGFVTLDFTDVTAQIDATSVTLTAPDDPDGTLVLEQNYLYDVVGVNALLQRYLEKTIEITAEDGAHFVGQLLSTTSRQMQQLGMQTEIILRLSDGQIITLVGNKIRDIRFPSLPGGLITRPTLRWLLQSANAGERPIEITYLTGGLNWTADYNLLLATDNAAFDISGWITLSNTTGASFSDAQVKLVAGEVKRLPEPRHKAAYARAEALYSMAPQQVEQRELFEYQLYEINRPVTVNNNETKQVEFINVRAVPASTYYVFDAVRDFYGYQAVPLIDRYDYQSDVKHVATWLQFSTGDESGLGKDLPAGRLRAYQQDTDGSAVLIGEETIQHTPKGETVDLELGKAFDLVAERRQAAYKQLSQRLLEETYEIHLRNRKDTAAVQIRVRERLFRWSNWEILESSHPFTPLDSSTIEFRPDVPPGGEVIVAYTVRYSWPG
jgi:hypothetical protein